jgi:pimeloyl-ACP methyl ester carboxylesterase
MAQLDPTAPVVARPAARPLTVRPLATIRADRRLGLAVAVGVGVLGGLVSALVMPRGPVTAQQGLVAMAIGLGIGLAAGLALRTTWAVIPAALAFMVAMEIGRIGAVGPTVDAVRFDSVFGILAVVVGRGLHGLLVFVPMLFGAVIGARVLPFEGARRAHGPVRRAVGLLATAALAVVTVALAVMVATPGSTPPVLDAAGAPIPGSLAAVESVKLGGHDQTIMIRAADPDAPVLLYLSGGPGQSDLALARALTTGWVQDLVFVDWDQRGNGGSYPALDPLATATLDQAVADTIELTEILRDRFGESKIYLMGESWGTILGVLAARERPDLYHAYIGSGQMVDVLATDRRINEDLDALAARTGDAALADGLALIGEPPYADLPWANAQVMLWYERLYGPYTPSESYVARGDASGLDMFGVLGTEYSLIDKANVLRGLMDTFAVMYPQIQGLDLRQAASRLQVPVVMLDGAAELAGRRDLALEWFAALEAPSKRLVTYEGAAHSVAFEQADEVQRLLVDTVIPETYAP